MNSELSDLENSTEQETQPQEDRAEASSQDSDTQTPAVDAPDEVAAADSNQEDVAKQEEPASTAPEKSAAEQPAEETEKSSGTGLAQFRVQIGSLKDRSVAEEAKPRPTISESGPDVVRKEKDPSAEVSLPPPPPKPTRLVDEDIEQALEAELGGVSLEDVMGSGGAANANANELEMDARIQGTVVSVHNEDIFVDLGQNRQGVVSLRQFEVAPEPGTKFEFRVVRPDGEDGLCELAIPGSAAEVADWSEVQEGLVVEATIVNHNKGGLECRINTLRAFMPMSQISLYRVENIEEFVGEKWKCLVTEVNPKKRNLVISRKAILEREQAAAREKLLDEIAVGQTKKGVVRSLQNFGAFVDIGSGIDGMIHISKLSWNRIKHPSEVLEVGQTVNVSIEKFDRQSGKISLDYLDRQENPWKTAPEKYLPETPVVGTVSKLTDFGAFVKLEPGIEGLIHISEISHQRIARAADVLAVGQEVEAQVKSVDPDKRRIALSLKAMQAPPEVQGQEESAVEESASKAKKPKFKGPLRGGVGSDSGGEHFGLKW